MTDHEQFKGLVSLARDMRRTIIDAIAAAVGSQVKTDIDLTKVESRIAQLAEDADLSRLIEHRQNLKGQVELIDEVAKSLKKNWTTTLEGIDEVIIRKMTDQDVKTLTVDGLGKITRTSTRRYSVGDMSAFATDLQERVANGEPIEIYLDLFGTSLGVSKLDGLYDDGVEPIQGVDSSNYTTLRFTKAK